MRNRAGAFTLSELLVVIAITAVTAGVLSPVFLQARASAKKTVCASNIRQIFLGTMNYAQDYDDHVMPVGYQPVENPDSRTDRTWVQLVLPYVKSFHVFKCPSDDTPSANAEATFDQDLVVGDSYSQYYSASMHVNYGYNSQYFAPIPIGSGGPMQTTRSLSEPARPSSTLIYAESVYARDAAGQPLGGGSWLVVPPCRYARDARTHRTIDTFSNRPGNGGEVFTPSRGWTSNDAASGYLFGGTWPWHQGHLNVAFADGHIKAMTTTQLGDGCDVRPDWSGLINDSQAYLWDIN